ncbi:MAG: hypothetical protein WDZ39_00365 [Candidatus Spechtbacterales bacterium]
MTKRFWGKKPSRGKTPDAKKNVEEFGEGKQDIIMCPVCHCVYFYKSWRSSLEEYKQLGEEKNIKFKMCPADQMKKQGFFEGELILENVPEHEKEEIENLIEHIAERAQKRDPMDRILKKHDARSRIEIHTSENQLAVNMGKQVHKAHKGSKIDIKFSEEESVARIRVLWPKQ